MILIMLAIMQPATAGTPTTSAAMEQTYRTFSVPASQSSSLRRIEKVCMTNIEWDALAKQRERNGQPRTPA